MSAPLVNTKTAPRRTLKFNSLSELRQELDRLEFSHRLGKLSKTGNWCAGEAFDHCARIWECSIDGFPADPKPPLWLKAVGLLLRGKATSGNTAPAGWKLPAQATHLLPTPNCSLETGIGRLRTVLDRIDRGERSTKPSPVLGRITHEGWTRLNLGHCQLHLGFLQPG